MWDAIKNNPLLKTITIAILGVLGFGFAFNIMFGSSGAEMGQEMSGGYSLDNTLAYILAILIKVFLITIVITAIVAVIKYTRKYLGGGSQKANSDRTNLVDYIKADPILKTVAVVLLSILLLGTLVMISNSVFGSNGAYIMPSSYNYNMNYGFGLTGIVIFLVRFLLTISIIGLVVGTIVLFMQNKDKFNFGTTKYFKNEKTSSVKCEKCGCDIKSDWQCCPKCGRDVENNLMADDDLLKEEPNTKECNQDEKSELSD
jgi:uncharacterized membrane protein